MGHLLRVLVLVVGVAIVLVVVAALVVLVVRGVVRALARDRVRVCVRGVDGVVCMRCRCPRWRS